MWWFWIANPLSITLMVIGGNMLWAKLYCGTVWGSCEKDHFHSSGNGPG
jgi:hypothetical protein